MKVILINNVCGFGSTGRICVDISDHLIAAGHQCTIAYGHGYSEYPYSYKFGSRFENKLHSLFSKMTGEEGYWSTRGTRDLISFIERERPDIIHLHSTIIYYLNTTLLFEYLRSFRGKIFWTIHDCTPFTANCIYYSDIACQKWQVECNSCPQIRKPPVSWFFDQTKRIYSHKVSMYNMLQNMEIIAVSKWLQGELRKSMLNKFPLHQIYNWIDHEVFRPMDSREEIIDKYGLDPNKKILLGVSGGANSDVKLGNYVKLSKLIDPKKEQLVIVGRFSENIPQEIKAISYVEQPSELAKIYSAADIYVHMSSEETFGLIIAEAMSCGTPTIVFNSTACPEILHDEACGAIIEKDDITAVYAAIQTIFSKPKSYYSKKCRDRVVEAYNKQRNIQDLLSLYNA